MTMLRTWLLRSDTRILDVMKEVLLLHFKNITVYPEATMISHEDDLNTMKRRIIKKP